MFSKKNSQNELSIKKKEVELTFKFETELEKLIYEALRIRLAEQRCAEIYPSDKIQSPVHLSIGQEHISVGACAALRKTDLVFGSYRGHALYLAKGGNMKEMFAELFGKKAGCGAGKAGSMHLSDASIGMMGSSAIVASTIPHAVGAALAAKVRKSDQVIVCFYGEGATGEGVYHESINFAAMKKLPILFLCENNDLSIYSKVSQLHSYEVTEHATAYKIKSKKIKNGCDLQHIADTCRNLFDLIRNGEGPYLLEIETYRYRQHVGPNEDYDVGYRNRSQLEEWLAIDPLFQNKALIKRFSPAIEEEIEEAIAFAEAAEFPQPLDLYTDIY